jgi:hypothetical protein
MGFPGGCERRWLAPCLSHIEDACPVKRLLHALPDTFLERICHGRTGTPNY